MLNSASQCCSRVSPTIFVESFSFISFRREISSSLIFIISSLVCNSERCFSFKDFFKSSLSVSFISRLLERSSLSFSITFIASETANFFSISAFSTLAFISVKLARLSAINFECSISALAFISAISLSFIINSLFVSFLMVASANSTALFFSDSATLKRFFNSCSNSRSLTCFCISAKPASSILNAVLHFGQFISFMFFSILMILTGIST